jgi:hypothetical protein
MADRTERPRDVASSVKGRVHGWPLSGDRGRLRTHSEKPDTKSALLITHFPFRETYMGRRTSSSADPIERASVALFGRERTLGLLAAVLEDDTIVNATQLSARLGDDVGVVSKELIALERGGLQLFTRLTTESRTADFRPADTHLWEAARQLIDDIETGKLEPPPAPRVVND